MTPADRKPFLEVLVGFAELKGKQLSAPAMELYWRAMQQWTLSEFKAAAEQLLRTCEFMPLPKDFEDLRKAGRQTPGEAWADVLRFSRHEYRPNGTQCINYGHDEESPRFDPFVLQVVNAIGGFRAIAMSDTDKTQFLERRFCEHFATMQQASDVREAVPEIAYSGSRSITGPQSARNLLGKLGGNS
jgi:hypothetical protein